MARSRRFGGGRSVVWNGSWARGGEKAPAAAWRIGRGFGEGVSGRSGRIGGRRRLRSREFNDSGGWRGFGLNGQREGGGRFGNNSGRALGLRIGGALCLEGAELGAGFVVAAFKAGLVRPDVAEGFEVLQHEELDAFDVFEVGQFPVGQGHALDQELFIRGGGLPFLGESGEERIVLPLFLFVTG